ncbi:hypothetical protein SEA_BIG4_272 [Microbacterium phage Big4]|nr:hypothetical protein SEA_BIG4_272 [Microbacterium phage Big4]
MRYAILRVHNDNYSLIGLPEESWDEWVLIEANLSKSIAELALKGANSDS